ncbi:aminoglycoside 6'-N-acetyltransferase [Rhizobium leucaenae]|uniref:Aminoglycoside N(6')-acetyltransferase type 1 n=1 Tax=Rhizobium leucaenae TaxID=29450 RepID=A0A7W6ZPH7_9HYPH|nr:aminoglycoside 6'-N-acetyltransferase [Rhizobium leucaenae]MBB4566164.1 aminoglycoside 6'-N-acetyltransferase I [Rhizobium leucaenae]MBB6302486.1 aminoglycoside 6'-N-acetyltransferase I [Rhizobium leucaenae]
MRIEEASAEYLDVWSRLCAELWPENPIEYHRAELMQFLSKEGAIAYLACDQAGDVVGFAEATLRHDYVNGCETSPVLFLEGIYVLPEHRRQGVARSLCDAVAAWGRAAGCHEFGSDALLDNVTSHAFHAALGFEETERVVYFRKPL